MVRILTGAALVASLIAGCSAAEGSESAQQASRQQGEANLATGLTANGGSCETDCLGRLCGQGTCSTGNMEFCKSRCEVCANAEPPTPLQWCDCNTQDAQRRRPIYATMCGIDAPTDEQCTQGCDNVYGPYKNACVRNCSSYTDPAVCEKQCYQCESINNINKTVSYCKCSNGKYVGGCDKTVVATPDTCAERCARP